MIIGNKARNLMKIKERFNVPESYIINETISKKASHILDSASLMKVLEPEAKKITSYFKSKNIRYVAVRSSTNLEDSKYHSFAGLFESVLNVKVNEEDILNALTKVFLSTHSKEVETYKRLKKINEETIMQPLIQEMITPNEETISGVLFYVDNEFIIEYIHGKTCEFVVKGYNDVSLKGSETEILEKVNKKDYRKVKEVIECSKELNSLFKFNLDIEFTYREKLYILQVREATGFSD